MYFLFILPGLSFLHVYLSAFFFSCFHLNWFFFFIISDFPPLLVARPCLVFLWEITTFVFNMLKFDVTSNFTLLPNKWPQNINSVYLLLTWWCWFMFLFCLFLKPQNIIIFYSHYSVRFIYVLTSFFVLLWHLPPRVFPLCLKYSFILLLVCVWGFTL